MMFDRAAQEEFDEFNYRLQSQGIDFDTYLNYTGMERDAMMAMYREQAETNVKTVSRWKRSWSLSRLSRPRMR